MPASTQEAEDLHAMPRGGDPSDARRHRLLPTTLSRVVAVAAAVLLVAALALLVTLPLLDMRASLGDQVELTERLLDRIGDQEALLEQQVELSSKLLERTDEGLEVGREGVDVGREGVDVGREGLDVGYEGLELGREMLAEIREIRERTPRSPAAVEEPTADLVD